MGNVVKIVQRNNFQKEVTLFDLPAHGACTMFRKKLVELSGGYDENFSRQDGYDMWLNLAHSYKIGNINKPLFFESTNFVTLEADLIEDIFITYFFNEIVLITTGLKNFLRRLIMLL